jgi:hypothetical protein
MSRASSRPAMISMEWPSAGRARQEFAAVLGFAQRVRTYRTDLVGVDVPQALAETLEDIDGMLHHGTGQPVAFIEPGREPHHFFHPIDHLDAPIHDLSHDQVEAVGPEVHGRQAFRGAVAHVMPSPPTPPWCDPCGSRGGGFAVYSFSMTS